MKPELREIQKRAIDARLALMRLKQVLPNDDYLLEIDNALDAVKKLEVYSE